ncbi:MAG: S-layer homology domain-containing protein [Capsulimonadales bacterium]|nr:S-layer homology domain-containing protein [Capsulimonadales bacterium]
MRNRAPFFPAALIGVFALTPAQAQVAGFSDVPANHWAAESVQKLAAMGILQGNPVKKPTPAKFDGNKPVTRYELAATLYRFVLYMERADRQPKSKLGADASGADAVKYLTDNGYLPKGTPLAKNGNTLVTANLFADSLYTVMARIREKSVPVTPGSKYSAD